MIEAVMIWNEPNNKSHWDFDLDPGWARFAEMTRIAAEAIGEANAALPRVLGGLSPIDPRFIANMRGRGVLDVLDVVAVHGFPLDWNHWQIDRWPEQLAEIRAACDLPVWVSEVGASSFGAEEVQMFGLTRSAQLLVGQVPRIHWYSLYDLPKAWPATTRHREAEGSSYYRHFYMGLLREDGTPKLALEEFGRLTPALGLCQWFHFEDHRLSEAVEWMRRLGVRHLRTGLSWADSFRPQALEWFDRQMRALEEFDVTVTFCFTPEHMGVVPHHTSPPIDARGFANFCAGMVRRYMRQTEALGVGTELSRALAIAPNAPLLVIVAHPDDETIGAGGMLSRWESVWVLHVTDGAPRNGQDAAAAGFANWREYAFQRSAELRAAMELAGVPSKHCIGLGVPDQEASLQMEPIARGLADRIRELRPAVVLTHSYEGGHPDHDATAFAVHAACQILRQADEPVPPIIEMAFYNAVHGASGQFLGMEPTPACVELSGTECDLKRRMLDCFTSQKRTLESFPVGQERYRRAPEYDFARPPHEGPLYYERFDWGMTGSRWRELANAAMKALGKV